MTSHSSSQSSRRRKIGATVAVVAVIGVAGGYGTYSAFTDTTQLNGTATAGAVQLNDKGSDSRSFSVANLLPGDAPSICFDVAAPAAGNTQPLSVTLVTARTGSSPTAADDALSGALNITLEAVPIASEDFTTLDGAPSTNRTLARTDTCAVGVLNPGGTGTITTVGTASVTGIAALGTSHGPVTIAAGAKRRYRLTVALPGAAPDAAQGGTATFSFTWTGSAGTS